MGLFTDAAPVTPSPTLTLAPGQSVIPEVGWYWYGPGASSAVQRYDSRMRVWRHTGDDSFGTRLLYSDGSTLRIANTSGCAVAAVVTTAGSGLTPATAPTVTASEGGSVWQAIVGGALSTAAIISVAGAGYTYPPVLWIEAPPQPGIPATAYATISNGSVSAVTIVNQGAGYSVPPIIAAINDPRDTTGYGAQINATLLGGGTVTGLMCVDHGSPIASGTIPTLTFSAGSAAATVVMDWGVTGVTVGTPGAGYGASGAVLATGAGGYNTSASVLLNNQGHRALQRWRAAAIQVATDASGSLTTATIIDPGRYQAIPTPAFMAIPSTPTTTGVMTFAMGGSATTISLTPAQ